MEIIKFTGMFQPIRQMIHHDIFDSIPSGDVNRNPRGCRYDDCIRIYGQEMQDRLAKVQAFIVGAGSLGGE